MDDIDIRKPRGFRLIDLVVLLGVGFILFSVMAAGIGKVREAAARTRCQSMLKQIGLAIHDYASAYRNELPPLSGAPVTGRIAHPSSIMVEILPFIEQDRIYKPVMASPNGCSWQVMLSDGPVFSNAHVMTFVCPSDPSNAYKEALARGWVGSSYAANALVFGNVAEVVTDRQAPPQSWNVLRSEYTIGSTPDGTSNTIFLAERFALAGGAEGTPCAWANPPAGGAGLGNPNVDAMGFPLNAYVSNNGPLRASICGPGIFFGSGTADDPVGARGGVPLYPPPEIGVSPWRASTDGRAQAAHNKVVQVGMGDGSSRGVTAAVSQLTWVRAICPDDRQGLGSDW
jgi:hypothetical protein